MINAEQYIPLVHKLTIPLYRRMKSRYSYDDMFQTGCLGLMRAANKFDESKNCKFITYAYRSIQGTLLNLARDDSWYVANSCRERLKSSYTPSSLDILVGTRRDTPIGDLISTQDDIQDFNILDLRIALDKLSYKYRKVVELRYFDELTQAKVAKILGVKKVEVSKFEKQALKLLRKELSA